MSEPTPTKAKNPVQLTWQHGVYIFISLCVVAISIDGLLGYVQKDDVAKYKDTKITASDVRDWEDMILASETDVRPGDDARGSDSDSDSSTGLSDDELRRKAAVYSVLDVLIEEEAPKDWVDSTREELEEELEENKQICCGGDEDTWRKFVGGLSDEDIIRLRLIVNADPEEWATYFARKYPELRVSDSEIDVDEKLALAKVVFVRGSRAVLENPRVSWGTGEYVASTEFGMDIVSGFEAEGMYGLDAGDLSSSWSQPKRVNNEWIIWKTVPNDMSSAEQTQLIKNLKDVERARLQLVKFNAWWKERSEQILKEIDFGPSWPGNPPTSWSQLQS